LNVVIITSQLSTIYKYLLIKSTHFTSISFLALSRLCTVVEVHRDAIEECGVGMVVDSPQDHNSSPHNHTSNVTVCVSPVLASTPLRYSLNISTQGVSS